ncbi:LacI family DNA-binding transcriptional regulator [Lacticaseibacillus zhaodongensis]|uniref:LacI family DNA-binding transcriptional regulator n=1 Tax=Lacticaseibacillus zhaodongensis TaxID=2668065 RepID=UPI0012D2EBC3|nr:LacI family DNA-binding transcriptional regulator [Lacticaseibacillus zhaodongensis]
MAQKKISIKEIAALSGVSTATVSRVINNNGRFSEQTRQRVLAVIRAKGYEPNAVAKGLRMQRTSTIGIVVPDLNNSFFSDLVEKIESQFFAADYSTIICDTARNPDKEASYLRMLESKLVDGIVVISGSSDFDPDQLSRKIPVVCIDRRPARKDVMYIASDHYAGAVLATAELIKAGTKPLFILPSRTTPTTRSRLAGYQDTLEQNGLTVEPDSVLRLTANQDADIDSRRTAIRAFLRQQKVKQSGTIGVFAHSDNLAADTLIAARSMDLSMPDDLKIIGFDDAPIARYCSPELTTVHQDVAGIAQRVSEYLVAAIQGADVPAESEQLVAVHLVKRGTA